MPFVKFQGPIDHRYEDEKSARVWFQVKGLASNSRRTKLVVFSTAEAKVLLYLNCEAFDGILGEAVTVNVTVGTGVVGEIVTVDTWGRGFDKTRTNRPMRPHILDRNCILFRSRDTQQLDSNT